MSTRHYNICVATRMLITHDACSVRDRSLSTASPRIVAVCRIPSQFVACSGSLSHTIVHFCPLCSLLHNVAHCRSLSHIVAVCRTLSFTVAVCRTLSHNVKVCSILSRPILLQNVAVRSIAECVLLRNVANCRLLSYAAAVDEKAVVR